MASAKPRRPRRQPVFVGVWLADIRNVNGERPGKLLTLDDATHQVITWLDSDLWMRYSSVLKKDTLIFVHGDLGLSQREGRDPEWRLYAKEFFDLDNTLRDRIASIELRAEQPRLDVVQLRRILEPMKAQLGARVAIDYRSPSAQGVLEFGAGWFVRADWAGLQKLRRLLGAERVCVNYRKWRPPIVRGEPAPVD